MAMSWSDRLQGLRNGSLPFEATGEGALGKLLRKVSPRVVPPPTNSQRFEPRGLANPVETPAANPEGDPGWREFGVSDAPSPRLGRGPRTTPHGTRRPLTVSRIGTVRSFSTGERMGDSLEIVRNLRRDEFFDTYVARHLLWRTTVVVKVPAP